MSSLSIFQAAMMVNHTKPINSNKKTLGPSVLSERAIIVLTAIFNQLLPFSRAFIEEQAKRMAFLIALRRPLTIHSFHSSSECESANCGGMIVSKNALFDRRLCGMIWSYILNDNALDVRALAIWGYLRWAPLPSIKTARDRIIRQMHHFLHPFEAGGVPLIDRHISHDPSYRCTLQQFVDYHQMRSYQAMIYSTSRSAASKQIAKASSEWSDIIHDFHVFGYQPSLESRLDDDHATSIIKQLNDAAISYDTKFIKKRAS
jgi:hypothetical protein